MNLPTRDLTPVELRALAAGLRSPPQGHPMPQNRPYPVDQGPLMVKATFTDKDGVQTTTVFDWNKREDVRTFAARSDAHVRAGGTTTLGQLTVESIACPHCKGLFTSMPNPHTGEERLCVTCNKPMFFPPALAGAGLVSERPPALRHPVSGTVYQTPADLVAALRVATASSYTIVAGSDAWQHMGKLTSLGEQAANVIERMLGLADPSGTKGITLVSYPAENKIRIIKTIRSAMGISLTQAMQASERLPFAIHFLSPHGGTTWDDLASDLRAISAVIAVHT